MWSALALLSCLCASCSSHRPRWEATWQSPGAEFDPGEELALRAARTYYDEGRLEAALDLLRPVARDARDNLELGFWLQDLEWERAEQVGQETEPLVTAHAERAQSDPTPANLILAARLMEGDEALALLDDALTLDRDNAWAHYTRAHVLLGDRQLADRWPAARAALARALELDPSHLRARHLEAWILAQEGDVAQAAIALEHWLDQTRGDPRVAHVRRMQDEVDLALMWVRLGLAEEAEALLLTHAGQQVGRARRLAVMAVAQHEQGRIEDSLDTARRAELADPEALLPIVQQALLHGQLAGSPKRPEEQERAKKHLDLAQERWQEVVDAAAHQGDLAGLLQSVRARVHLEGAGQPKGTVDPEHDDGAEN
ncbi:MAG TPA: hypothetical protein EYQ74_13405 [Planctomycetes bacterium]|nr:hypothetical protein [Planctomycetota bacterium]HIK61970.1 hypothetical protein [Planctomycetota bacterium]